MFRPGIRATKLSPCILRPPDAGKARLEKLLNTLQRVRNCLIDECCLDVCKLRGNLRDQCLKPQPLCQLSLYDLPSPSLRKKIENEKGLHYKQQRNTQNVGLVLHPGAGLTIYDDSSGR